MDVEQFSFRKVGAGFDTARSSTEAPVLQRLCILPGYPPARYIQQRTVSREMTLEEGKNLIARIRYRGCEEPFEH